MSEELAFQVFDPASKVCRCGMFNECGRRTCHLADFQTWFLIRVKNMEPAAAIALRMLDSDSPGDRDTTPG